MPKKEMITLAGIAHESVESPAIFFEPLVSGSPINIHHDDARFGTCCDANIGPRVAFPPFVNQILISRRIFYSVRHEMANGMLTRA